jgi:hypothetical protein
MERLEIQHQISYSCIFPDSSLSIDDVIRNLPSKKAIEWVSYMYLLRSQKTITQTEHSLFIPLLFKLDKQLQHSIVDYMQNVDISNMIFIDKVALLILLENLLSAHNNDAKDLSENDFSNLMIAYLMCCDERLSFNRKTLEKISDANSFVKIFLPEQLKFNDIYFPKDYRVDFIRFYMFMNFCENDIVFKPFLEIFLESNGIKNWDEYLFFVFDLYLEMVLYPDGCTNKIKIDPDSYFGKKYLSEMSIDVEKYKSNFDFKGIRSKPVYYQGDNTYNVLAINFFIDKLYQSFLFDFATALIKHKEITKIKSYPDLKKLIGDQFSEKYLFYAIMDGCFDQIYNKRISGQELKVNLKEGEPDYYIRKGKNIFLFEYKDVMIDAQIKHCEDFNRIEKDLLEKFESSTYEKSTGKIRKTPQAKGVTQLLNVIQKKLDEIIAKSDKVECSERFNVFPIIVYQDCCFDIEGVNYILNNRFQVLLKSRTISDQYNIRSLVMLSLTTLIQLEDFFSNGNLDFGNIINGYITECSLSESNKTLPLNKYLMRHAIKKGYNHQKTRRFDDIINNLIEKRS